MLSDGADEASEELAALLEVHSYPRIDHNLFISMGIIPLLMFGSIILYRFLKKTPQTTINRFCKAFYGQDTSSQQGRYRYHRHGLLDDIHHRRLIRGVIIVKAQDAETVLDFLKDYPLEVHVREIKLDTDDCHALGLSME